MSDSTRKNGRPIKYSYDELKEELLKYAHENLGEIITLSELGRKTKYPRHVWRNNSEIRKDIDKLNETPIEVFGLTKEHINIPSAEDLVNTNYKDKKRLITVVQQLLDVYQKTFEKALTSKELEEALESEKMQKQQYKELAEYYEDKYKKMCIASTTSRGRKENGLKENELDAAEKLKTINNEFEDLFK